MESVVNGYQPRQQKRSAAGLFGKGEAAAAAVEALGPVFFSQIGNHYVAAGRVAGVDEAIITEIDTHMRECAAQRIEKHQIARFELGSGDLLTAVADRLW